jgi:hypothetical protein
MGCKVVLNESDLEEGKCPICNTVPEKMCKLDKVTCSHPSEDVMSTVVFCEECGKPICPICSCHDVSQVSRITGYLSEIGGWNQGKQAELRDRTHYDVA